MVEAKQWFERAGPMPGLSRTFVVIHATQARMMKTSRDSPSTTPRTKAGGLKSQVFKPC